MLPLQEELREMLLEMTEKPAKELRNIVLLHGGADSRTLWSCRCVCRSFRSAAPRAIDRNLLACQ